MGNSLSGGYLSFIAQMLPPSPKWTAKDMPDLTGKVVIVTGGNTGIGKETVKGLLEHNAKVYLAARSKDKAEAAILDLKRVTGREAIFLKLDLGNLASVRASAREFSSKEQELHILINNAGIMWPPIDSLTEDGFDIQWGTNVVGHWLFTELLMPTILRAAANATEKKARIVTVSSSGSYLCPALEYASFRDGPERKKMGTQNLYFQSKFGNVIVAKEVARRYGDKGVVSTSLNPGNLESDLTRYMSDRDKKLATWVTYPTWYGALTQLWAGTAPGAAEMNGKWLIPWARVGCPNPKTQDPETGRKLWEWLEENTKGR